MSSLNWKKLTSLEQFDELLEKSRTKPALILKHKGNSPESIEVRKTLEKEWNIPEEHLDVYDIDNNENASLCNEITNTAGVDNEFPQVLLFADGVTMYDESHEMINVKKIKIALKIINRTFKWMESRA